MAGVFCKASCRVQEASGAGMARWEGSHPGGANGGGWSCGGWSCGSWSYGSWSYGSWSYGSRNYGRLTYGNGKGAEHLPDPSPQPVLGLLL